MLLVFSRCQLSYQRQSPRRRANHLQYLACALICVVILYETLNSPSGCVISAISKRTAYVTSRQCNCTKNVIIGSHSESSSIEFEWCSEESSLRGRHQKVISYTIFGNAESDATIYRRYYSMLRNISRTAERLYPGWIIRIYHNFTQESTDVENFQRICKVYCRFAHVDLCSVPAMVKSVKNSPLAPIEAELINGLNPRMFRYLAMLDPNVDIFISRDIDSVIRPREVDAVNEWLSSNYTFHVMRDQIYHHIIMLAGMWGAKIYRRRDLIEGLCRAMILSGRDQYFYHDQTALERILWPVAQLDVIAHDSYHCENERLLRMSPLKMVPFPTQRDGEYFIGGEGAKQSPQKCPLACRPPDHQDWEYC